MTTKKKRIYSLILVAALLAGFVSAGWSPSAGAAFSDTADHWADSAISRWAQMGILKGMGTDNFNPDDPITRAELCVIVARAFNAQTKGDLSHFTDISPTEWYYPDVAMAYQMGIINGTSDYTLEPDKTITRQDATVIIARALGLTTENTSSLGRFSDNEQISDYARRNIAALLDSKYINGFPDFTFGPQKTITRAEAVTIINNIITTIIETQSTESRSYVGTVVITRAGVSLANSNITGDLIIADGVGTGNVNLSNVTISGKLIIRGGGPNSVEMSNVRISSGVFVSNPTCTTRLNVTSSSSLGTVTARTSLTYLGAGASSFVVPSDAERGTFFTLSSNSFESTDISGPGARLSLNSGNIENVRFLPGADGSSLYLESSTNVGFISAGAPNITVSGSGTVDRVEITQNGVVIDPTPSYYSITDNINARIGKNTVYGRITDDTSTNVKRSNTSLAVMHDEVPTGGAGLKFDTSSLTSGNVVTVTQTGQTVPVSVNYGRSAYWVGFHIPAPEGHDSTVQSVKLSIDGSDAYTYNEELTDVTADGATNVTGLTIYLPVKRDGSSLIGTLSQNVYIHWNNDLYENLYFTGSVTLAALTSSQELTLVESYRSTAFTGYGESYMGSEALRRLLLTDNALGIDLRGYDTFSKADQASIAVQMYARRSEFTAKPNIQACLFNETVGKGALYAINRATNAEQIQAVFEDDNYAVQLRIETGKGSKYYMLSQWSRLSVAKTVLLARGTDFTSEDEVASIFDKMVDDLRTKETTLIVSLNTVRTREDMQKLLETKANADLIGISIDTEPYKSLAPAAKTAVAQEVMTGQPFATLDTVRAKFIEIVGEPKEISPETDRNITSITADPSTVNIAIGDTTTVTPTITTSSGTYKSYSAVTWAVDKSDIASISSTDGQVYGRAKGKAKITLTSTVDTKKKTSVTINVVDSVPSTGITLNKERIDVGEGETAALTATLIPAKSTDIVKWYSDDPTVAVFENGRVEGKKPGMTTLSARTPTGFSATCAVWVTSKDRSIILDKYTATVGIGSFVQIQALVSPVTLSNRSVTWSTSNNKVATVDATGRVSGAVGVTSISTATITATSVSDPNLKASCVVTVDPSILGVSLDVSKLTLYKNGIYTFKPVIVPEGVSSGLNWNVVAGGEKIISVKNGVVQGLTAGTAQVIVSLTENPAVFAICDVEVLSTVLKFTLNTKTAKINVGENTMLAGTFNPSTIINKTINYRSANPDIATVDASGKIVGVGTGNAKSATVKIYASPEADTSLEQEVTVTVSEVALKKVYFANTKITTYKGGQFDLIPIFDPANATPAFQPIKWESVVDTLVGVNNGHIKADKTTFWTEKVDVIVGKDDKGKNIIEQQDKMLDHPVTISATTSDGKIATCLISVQDVSGNDMVDNIRISLDAWIFQAGGPRQNVNVIFTPKPNVATLPDMKVTWTNGDPGIAYVDNNYLYPLTANNLKGIPAEATITATSADAGKSDTKTVTIANEGVTRVSLIGLTSTTSYDGLLRMDTVNGKVKSVKATPTTQGSADRRLVWEAFEPEYDTTGKPINKPVMEGKDDNNAGLVKKSSVVSVSYNEDTGEAVFTALSPGWARVTIQPYQKFKYGSTAEKKLSKMSTEELAWSRITKTGPEEGPNEYYGPYPALDKDLQAIPLDQTKEFPVILENKIIDGSNEFWVYVSPIDIQGVSLEDQNVDIGKRVTVAADLAPNNAIPAAVVWELDGGPIEDSQLVKVISREVSEGKAKITLEGLKGGQGNIKVTVSTAKILAPDGQTMYAGKEAVSATAKLNVDFTAVTGVSIADKPVSPNTIILYMDGSTGDTLQLKASALPEEATYKDIEWSSNNTSVLAVDSNGLVTAVYTGAGGTSAVITAKSKSNPAASDTIRIYVQPRPAVESVTLPGTRLTIPLNGELDVSIAIAPVGSYNGKNAVTWSINNSGVQIEVGTDKRTANLVGLSACTATLTVTVDGKFTTCEVVVDPNITQPIVNNSGVSVSSPVTTYSAPVRTETAAPSESTEATQTAPPSQTPTPSPTPTPAPTPAVMQNVALRSSANVLAGKTIKLVPNITPANAENNGFVWSSSAPDIASVKNGVVTGVKAGKATITVTDSTGRLKDTCKITVVASEKAPVTAIDFKNTTLDLKAGASSSLKVVYTPKTPTFKGVSWTSSNEKIARVDQNGKVTAVGSGSCVITATSDSGGKIALCVVNVTVPVKSISLSASEKSLKAGESFKPEIIFNPGDSTNKNVTWKVSNPSVATVAAGVITAHTPGRVTITVTSVDGKKSATCKITVTP